ncbi:MAG: hypothetical protein QG670_720 [Thermoproteota archaeon]|nr:hypothetical protein [Thermoproteota archaeon]
MYTIVKKEVAVKVERSSAAELVDFLRNKFAYDSQDAPLAN